MLLSWIWIFLIGAAILCAAVTGRGHDLSGAVMDGAQSGITLSISIAGSLCLWSGVGRLMDAGGLAGLLSRVLSPILHRLFPSTVADKKLGGALSANICANILGLGNAATPMGIQAVKRMVDPARPGRATDEMCRLIVLNTASIQLIPTTVAAVRSGLGALSPFDILPAVWFTSVCSAGLGLTAACLLGRFSRD